MEKEKEKVSITSRSKFGAVCAGEGGRVPDGHGVIYMLSFYILNLKCLLDNPAKMSTVHLYMIWIENETIDKGYKLENVMGEYTHTYKDNVF